MGIIEESKKAKTNGFGFWRNRKFIIIIAILIVAASVYYFWPNNNKERAQGRSIPEIWTVVKDDIIISVEADGKVVAEDGVELSFSVSGDTLEVEEVFIKEGQSIKKGDKIGFRGPFGTHFKIPKNSTAIATAGGGYGSAPLSYLTEEALSQGKKVYFIEGARTKARLLFTERMKQAGAEVLLCTDDGSEGPKCYSTDVLKTLLETHKIDKVFTCGPEIMMKKVAELSKEAKIPCEVSMERYMKCGIGVCGQCCVDDIGLCLCTNGPIISGDLALKIKEFGFYHRDSTGKKV